MACPFKLWVPPPGAPDITQKLCNWLPRAHGALQDDELGREILADLQQLSKECALLKLLFEILDCWHTTVHFLRNVAVMASAAANFNFLNWVTGAGGAAKDTLLSIVLTAFGERVTNSAFARWAASSQQQSTSGTALTRSWTPCAESAQTCRRCCASRLEQASEPGNASSFSSFIPWA